MKKPAILVVGGAGYIGSHMVLDLLRAGYPVVTLDDLSRGHRELVPGGDFIAGDMGDPAVLAQIFKQHPIRAVMHFAAHSQVGESVQQPLEYYRNNVGGGLSLLEARVRTDDDVCIGRGLQDPERAAGARRQHARQRSGVFEQLLIAHFLATLERTSTLAFRKARAFRID